MNKNFQIDANSEGEAFIVYDGKRTKLTGKEVTVADEKVTMATLAQELQALQNENKYLKRQLGLEKDPQAEVDGEEVKPGTEDYVAPQGGPERYASTEVDPKAGT